MTQYAKGSKTKKKPSGGCLHLIILIVIIFIGLGAKFCSSQSGISSRFGGDSAVLKAPEDCHRILSISKSEGGKYITYVTKEGIVKLKEYSDFGVLEAEYIVEGYREEVDLKKESKDKN